MIVLLVIVSVLALLLIWCLCKAASDADDAIDKALIQEWRNNNDTNNCCKDSATRK